MQVSESQDATPAHRDESNSLQLAVCKDDARHANHSDLVPIRQHLLCKESLQSTMIQKGTQSYGNVACSSMKTYEIVLWYITSLYISNLFNPDAKLVVRIDSPHKNPLLS
jgi:hypothetical protein